MRTLFQLYRQTGDKKYLEPVPRAIAYFRRSRLADGGQMDEATLHAVFGNVGSLISFQVGPSDAELLAEQLAGDVTEQDLIGLPRFTAYVRLLIEGIPSRPFSMETLPPASPRRGADRLRKVRNHSRHRYSVMGKG